MGREHRLVPRLPALRHTVRARLTALYGCLFLVSGAALLAITYGLVASRLSHLRVSSGPLPGGLAGGGPVRATSPATASLRTQQSSDLHQFLIQSGIALAIMAVAAVALGWLMSGRALRPLRAMTAATRQISERNLHERLALTGPRDELRDLADTIDGLLGRLDTAFDSQRRFVANASHELRTPLMLTQALLQVALAHPAITIDSLSAACQEVLLACKEQDRLIQALLTLARSQRGIDHHEPFDLAAITRHVVQSRGPEAAARSIRIDAALAPAPVTGDPRLTEILVSNLIENAIRHNIPGGRIRAAVSGGPGHVSLTVSNSGPQVPADQVERLLQPFQHLDRHRDHHRGGLGLGLSIVAAIAAAHGAALTVSPRPAGGLTIEVRFRCDWTAREKADGTPAALRPSAGTASFSGSTTT